MARCIRCIAGALLLSFFGLAQAAPQLLVPVAQPERGAGVNSLAKAGTGTAVRFNAEVLHLAPGSEVQLTLPNGSRHTYLFESLVPHGGGMTTWIARSPLTGTSERAIITVSEVGAWGWMKTAHGEWRIYPGDEADWLAASVPRDIAPTWGGSDAVVAGDDDPADAPFKGVATFVPTPALPKAFAMPKATPSPSARIDVMFLYTRDLASKLGAGLLPMLNNIVASANQAYADSEVAIVMRMVNATMVDVGNDKSSSNVLSAMRNAGTETGLRTLFEPLTWGAGSLRNTFGADYVALVRDGPTDTGGIGNLNANPTPGVVSQTTGYSVNNYCASGCESIVAHEVGHNMGLHHDRATIAKDNGGNRNAENGVFSDAHGYYSCAGGLSCNPFTEDGPLTCTGYADCAGNNANDFGTIMSYFSPKVNRFSNPALSNCVPSGGNAGTPRVCGVLGQTDEARGMNLIRNNLAAYRSETIANLPGSLQFTNVSYSGTEAGGTLTFTVSRVGGSSGAVSVNYATASGTASAGADFTAATGTLNWANGDTANKTFNVTLANDGIVEGIETFTAILSAPAGATGVYLGHPATAIGLVLENWPAGVGVGPTLPSGFTTGAASAAWTVADDQAFEGATSLRSGQLFGNMTDYQNSDLNLTANLGAGTLAFAYRVSAYQNYGVFEFLVNGSVVFTDTGETGWQVFFYQVPSGGSYNLTWRFKNRLSSRCNSGWNPPPEGGAACADRVWIDALSLPLALASSTTALVSSLNPSTTGQSVTFTATVSGSAGTPAGTVNFRDGVTTIGSCGAVALNGSGVASCATTALAAGTRSITAVYSGSSAYAGSTSNTVSQVVSGAQLLTSSPTTLAFGGQSMNTTSPTLTARLTASGAVTVTSVTPPAHYAIVGNTCAAPLSSGGTCDITVAFTPTAEGNRDGVILVNYAGGGPTPIFVTGTGERSLVTHYYRSILRRAPDAGGKTYWQGEAARVQALGANVNEVWFSMAIQFFFSTEYTAFNRDTNGFLTDLYTTFFNRSPDSGGLAYWASQIAGGMPREVVLAGFMFSPEFNAFTQAIFGTQAVRAEMDVVMDFYRGLLSRLPDDGGFNYWVGRFRAAQCLGAGAVYAEVEAISSGFADSPEYAARNRSNGQFVGDLYNSFLRRGGDLDGVNYWVGQLAAGARTRGNERQAFITTPEFSARVQAIINQGCL
jgi:hypothetical protein